MSAWHITEQGQAQVTQSIDSTVRLSHPAHDGISYHNAQISNYDHQRQFTSRPPLRLSLTAHASTTDLRGTAGFGFWNHALAPDESRFDLPQALWFFFSSDESQMALAHGMPAHGWKAATFNAKQWRFLGLLPTAPLAIPLMNLPIAYDALWPIGQHAIGVEEAHLDAQLLREPHRYTLDWWPDRAIFRVDERVVLEAQTAIPTHALGFVAWIDNQYAVVTPQGRFDFGLVPVPHAQHLILRDIELHPLG